MKSAIRALSPVFILPLALTLLVMSGCSNTPASPASTAHTYAATSSVGDFIQWTIDPTVTPAAFNVTWNVTDTSNNVIKTFTLSGTCGAADATYDYRQCTVNTTSDSTSVQAGAVFDVLEVPGVAVFAHPETAAGRGNGGRRDSRRLFPGQQRLQQCQFLCR